MSICYNYAENSEQTLFYRISVFKFLGAFAKSRKATIIFLTSIRPSAWNNSAPSGRILAKFDI